MLDKQTTITHGWDHNIAPHDTSRYTLHTSRTSFMQNKPNYKKPEIDLTPYKTRRYGENAPLTTPKNKPKTNPIKANSNPNQTQFKPKTNPNQTQHDPHQKINLINSSGSILKCDPTPSKKPCAAIR